MLKQKLARGHLPIYARVATWERMRAFQLTLSKIPHSWSMANKLTRQALSQDLAQTLVLQRDFLGYTERKSVRGGEPRCLVYSMSLPTSRLLWVNWR